MNKFMVLMLILGLSGCASVAGEGTQIITLRTSDNKNVKVKVKNINQEAVYTIPAKIKVKNSHNDLIITTVKTDCITPTRTVIQSKITTMNEWIYNNASNVSHNMSKDLEGLWYYDDEYTIKVQRDKECMKKAKELNDEIFNLHMM